MIDDKEKSSLKCIVCRSPIEERAQKCLHCGSFQGFRRHFDIGNTSLSMMTAFVAVLGASADNVAKVIKAFSDPLKPAIHAHVVEVGPKAVTLFLSNAGPGAATWRKSLLCPIWVTARQETLFVGKDDKFWSVRYPEKKEVIARHVYFFGDHSEAEIIEPGARKIVKLQFRELKVDNPSKNLPSDMPIASYCTIAFNSEGGLNDGNFVKIDPLSVSFFSLDRPEVVSILSKLNLPLYPSIEE